MAGNITPPRRSLHRTRMVCREDTPHFARSSSDRGITRRSFQKRLPLNSARGSTGQDHESFRRDSVLHMDCITFQSPMSLSYAELALSRPRTGSDDAVCDEREFKNHKPSGIYPHGTPISTRPSSDSRPSPTGSDDAVRGQPQTKKRRWLAGAAALPVQPSSDSSRLRTGSDDAVCGGPPTKKRKSSTCAYDLPMEKRRSSTGAAAALPIARPAVAAQSSTRSALRSPGSAREFGRKAKQVCFQGQVKEAHFNARDSPAVILESQTKKLVTACRKLRRGGKKRRLPMARKPGAKKVIDLSSGET